MIVVNSIIVILISVPAATREVCNVRLGEGAAAAAAVSEVSQTNDAGEAFLYVEQRGNMLEQTILVTAVCPVSARSGTTFIRLASQTAFTTAQIDLLQSQQYLARELLLLPLVCMVSMVIRCPAKSKTCVSFAATRKELTRMDVDMDIGRGYITVFGQV